jgi:hypothetical protein
MQSIMPYEADVSVNHAYNRGSARYGIKPHVSSWLLALRCNANRSIGKVGGRVAAGYPVTLDLEIIAPRGRGRMPDTSNFRKLIQDVLAAALGIDDSIFGGTDTPARRARDGEEPAIIIRLEWRRDD